MAEFADIAERITEIAEGAGRYRAFFLTGVFISSNPDKFQDFIRSREYLTLVDGIFNPLAMTEADDKAVADGKRVGSSFLAGPFWPKHDPAHAPRGYDKADWLPDARRCPNCNSMLVHGAGWEWCFNHDHDVAGGTFYICGYEKKLA